MPAVLFFSSVTIIFSILVKLIGALFIKIIIFVATFIAWFDVMKGDNLYQLKLQFSTHNILDFEYYLKKGESS